MGNNKPLTDVEWDTCWMAIRYAMGRQTAASASLPKELCRAYFYRWSDNQKEMIVKDLRQHLKDVARWNGDGSAFFGNKNIDHPEWMKFLLCLDKAERLTLIDTEGNVHQAFKFNEKFYPIDWWRYLGEQYFNPKSICQKQN